MSTLSDLVADSAKRDELVRDATAILEAEVAGKRGLSGVAVKGAFKVVRGLSPSFIPRAIDGLLDDFMEQLEPFYADYCSGGSQGTFGSFLSGRSSAVADALLSTTDKRAETTDHKLLRSTYTKLRPKGKQHVQEAMPAVGRMVDRHMAGV